MLKTPEMYMNELHPLSPLPPSQALEGDISIRQHRARFHLLKQLTRFSLVGGLNTLIDLLVLNALLLLWPASSTLQLLLYNALAYGVGAGNSFVWNKYWTFQQRRRLSLRECWRFTLTTLLGMGLNSGLLWLAGRALTSLHFEATLQANAAKLLAISVSMLISFLGMRLWVFASKIQQEHTRVPVGASMSDEAAEELSSPPAPTRQSNPAELTDYASGGSLRGRHSLSVVLPAYNEEEVIASTIVTVLDVLTSWHIETEILVVNDGSSDRTGAIVAQLAAHHPQIRLINHPTNQGYGAALVSGFEAATKELTFFMDSDGQFDIRALRSFFPFIETYDAVLGYRLNRQDSWMRKFNAWGWKMLVRLALGVKARDIDCAFKLFHTSFLREHPLETRGAMINAELLYKLKQGQFSQREVGVPHFPRMGGRATGAHPRVIARALRDLFICTLRWRLAARVATRQTSISNNS